MRQQKKGGCGFSILLLLILGVMFFLIVTFLPPGTPPGAHNLNHNQVPSNQSFMQQVQNFIKGMGHTPTPATHSSLPAPSGTCFDQARTAATNNGIDPTLYARQINEESGCRDVTGMYGEQGPAQFMPAMVAYYGINPHNIPQALNAGAKLMASYLKSHSNSWPEALSCYNAGTGTTNIALQTYGANWFSHIPASTQRYIIAITGGQA